MFISTYQTYMPIARKQRDKKLKVIKLETRY